MTIKNEETKNHDLCCRFISIEYTACGESATFENLSPPLGSCFQ